MKLNRTASALVAGSAALALVLAGCSADDKAATATESASSKATEATSEMKGDEAAVTLKDAYIKEKPADKKMTGIFGTFSNSTDKDIKIESFSVEGLKEGTKFEQHDTKDGKMFEVEGGLTIPAGGELALAPGSKHLMIMNNDEAMEAGAEYKLVVKLADGSSVTQDIQVRVQAAGEENYGSDGQLENPGHNGSMEGKMDGEKGMDHEGHNHDMGHEGHNH